MNRDLVFLPGLSRYADAGLLIVRVLTGAFLVYGVADNIASSERMAEFATFMAANGFWQPQLLAPFSVYVQLLCGIALILGLLTRWTGIVVALHFVVALVMVHWAQDFRGWWPALVLVGIGCQFALTGAGSMSVDAALEKKQPG